MQRASQRVRDLVVNLFAPNCKACCRLRVGFENSEAHTFGSIALCFEACLLSFDLLDSLAFRSMLRFVEPTHFLKLANLGSPNFLELPLHDRNTASDGGGGSGSKPLVGSVAVFTTLQV